MVRGLSNLTCFSQGSYIESLFHKSHCSADYAVGEASIVEDCNHDFLATLNQSFPDSTKMDF